MTITDVLNQWNQIGVFSYVIPFLLMFALTYAILIKTHILGRTKSKTDNNGKITYEYEGENKALMSIISIAVSLLALQFDFVSTFYAQIFPRFGMGLAILLVVVIFLAFFGANLDGGSFKWIGYVLAGGVIIWALYNWEYWGGYWGSGFGMWWIEEYFWSIVILGGIIGLIYWVSKPQGTG